MTDDEPSLGKLTPEQIARARSLFRWQGLPTLYYRVSDIAPITVADGSPAIVGIDASASHPPYVVVHPDNVPVLERLAIGKYHLVRLCP